MSVNTLIPQIKIVGPALVKAVTALLPIGTNVETILENTNNVIIQRAVIIVKGQNFQTAIHVVESLWKNGLSESSVISALNILVSDTALPEVIRTDIQLLIKSGLISSVYTFVSAAVPLKAKLLCGCY